jgi:hypothetical protein
VIVVANLLNEKLITTTLGGDNMSQMVFVLKWLSIELFKNRGFD